MYTHNYYKQIFTFFSSQNIRMSRNSINFNDKKKNKKVTFTTKIKKYLI